MSDKGEEWKKWPYNETVVEYDPGPLQFHKLAGDPWLEHGHEELVTKLLALECNNELPESGLMTRLEARPTTDV